MANSIAKFIKEIKEGISKERKKHIMMTKDTYSADRWT